MHLVGDLAVVAAGRPTGVIRHRTHDPGGGLGIWGAQPRLTRGPASREEEPNMSAAEQFIDAFIARDWDTLRSLLADECIWTMPGTGRLSGNATGADAVVARARYITSDGLNTELLHALTGANGSAVILRNTAAVAGRVLDEHLATVITSTGEQIVRVDTYLSDVAGKDAFFT